MRLLAILFLFVFGISAAFGQKLQLRELTCEYQDNPVGIDVTVPHFSWKLVTSQRAVIQKSYELRVSMDPKSLVKGQNLVWHSGIVVSDQSTHVPYRGIQLNSRQRYYWQVRVQDNTNAKSVWSEVKFWEMG